MSSLHWMTASDAAKAIAAGTLSPVALMSHLLARVEQRNGDLHAFIRLDKDEALAAARAAEAQARAGQLKGPLHGVPVGIKDVIDVAGKPTTCHSKILAGNIATNDATCVRKLREAGAIIFGKLSTHEFAMGGPSFDLPWPPARNPWNRDHHPGGSSSGSGAAVAAGLVPLAIGTDTAGSVRHPASACAIVGTKPTHGLVSQYGLYPLCPKLDHIGPMTRTVADSALILQAMAGHDPLDPTSSREPAPIFASELDQGVRGLRIGFIRHFHETDMPAHPEVAAGLEAVAKALRGEGAVITDIVLPPLQRISAATFTLIQADAWARHQKWLVERPGDYGTLGRRRLMTGAFLTAEDVAEAERTRGELIAAVDAALRDVDVLMCASSMDPPCGISDSAELERTYPRQARVLFNLTGHPALAMASGISKDGLPLSVQFAGRYFEDARVLRVARMWERIGCTNQLHPPDL